MKAKRHPRDSKNSSGSETNERTPHLKSHHPNLKRKASNNLKSQVSEVVIQINQFSDALLLLLTILAILREKFIRRGEERKRR